MLILLVLVAQHPQPIYECEVAPKNAIMCIDHNGRLKTPSKYDRKKSHGSK